MNDLGMLSVCSAYRASVNSVYNSTKASSVENIQELSSEKDAAPNLMSNDEIIDEAIISDAAMALLIQDKIHPKGGVDDKKEPTTLNDKKTEENKSQIVKTLSPEQQQVVAELKARDAEVKAHEQAHLAAAAGINVSAPTYTYQTGPDGQKYAIGGEVSISFSASNDPQETISNAETMKAAALAPADPSGQDLSVANSADKMIAEAKQQLAKQEQDDEHSTIGALKPDKPSGEQPTIGGVAKNDEELLIGFTAKSDAQPTIGLSASLPQEPELPRGLIA